MFWYFFNTSGALPNLKISSATTLPSSIGVAVIGESKFLLYDQIINKSVIVGNYMIHNYEQENGLDRLVSVSKKYSVLSFGIHKTSARVRDDVGNIYYLDIKDIVYIKF